MNGLKSVIYNCRKATFLIDKRMGGKISFRESIELRVHLIRCDVCKLYVKQSEKINEMIKALLKAPAGVEIRLDEDFKKGLQVTIDDQLNKN
jgi:tRNA/tmRNA/rRNA uracil-C5-methylase (TrmA/RlmC/RlmD family)